MDTWDIQNNQNNLEKEEEIWMINTFGGQGIPG
jgi:hypothetical protein